MNSNILIAPSLNSLFFTGFFILWIFILIIINFIQILKLNYYQKIILLSTISIAIGVHGLIHLGAETVYNFNTYKWF
jgi:hypothetical protein